MKEPMLLSDITLQDNCLLVYCVVPWKTCVLMRMRAITVSSKSRLLLVLCRQTTFFFYIIWEKGSGTPSIEKAVLASTLFGVSVEYDF